MARGRRRREVSAGGVVFRRGQDGTRYLLIHDGHGARGFPKGHLKPGESPLDAAVRELQEETGLDDLVLHGELDVINWYFRFRGALIHKYCHLFLFESPGAAVQPQLDEGITECAWYPLDDAVQALTHDNARSVLHRAGEVVRMLGGEDARAAEG